jgi:hypothetical protein
MATRCITAHDVAAHLTNARHINAVRRSAWAPGFRVGQASPRTVRLWHDGPDEQPHLDLYAETLRAAGYTVIPERSAGKRPALRITHP